MEDEEFEKVFKTIAEIFWSYSIYDGGYEAKTMWIYKEDIQKAKLKQILEEIELNAYEKTIKDFNDLANGKITTKVTYYKETFR